MSKSASVGTTLTVNSQTVGGLKSINGIEVTADSIDTTSLDNTSGYRTKLLGFKDAGEVTCSGFLDGADTGQDEMYTDLGTGDIVPCTIVFPTAIAKTWSFNASVSKFSTGVDVDGAITFDATLLVSGAPTLADTV